MYTARSSIGQVVYGSLTGGIEQTRKNEANHGRRVFHTHALHTSDFRSLCIFSWPLLDRQLGDCVSFSSVTTAVSKRQTQSRNYLAVQKKKIETLKIRGRSETCERSLALHINLHV